MIIQVAQLPAVPPAHLPHGADPPPLRAARLARDDRDRPLLDARRPVHRARASGSSTPTSSTSAVAGLMRAPRRRAWASPARPSRARSSATARRSSRRRRADDRTSPADGVRPASARPRRAPTLLDAVDMRRAEPRRARAPPVIVEALAAPACRSSASSTSRPIGTTAPAVVAITGTNGKTTVTTMVTDMLDASGRDGGRGRQHRGAASSPPSTTRRRRVRGRGVVVPAAVRRAVRARRSATWLNLAPDHLDLHGTVDALRGGQGAHLGAPVSRTRSRSPTPTTRS